MQIGYISDVGQKRELNEDGVLVLKLDTEFHAVTETAGLFILADGMGGHKAGEVASELGIRTFAQTSLPRLLSPVGELIADESAIDDPCIILNQAMGTANRILYGMSKKKGDTRGMGTAITAAFVTGQDLYVTNVGDSRCYLINEREMVQITKDHSLVQEMADAGLISPEEARTHPRKNVLTRVVGYSDKVKADNYRQKLYQGDHILLCSDGLWALLSDQQISDTVLVAESPQQACVELVAQANQLGGLDNISAIIVKPEHLPVRQELLTAETQVIQIPQTARNQADKQGKRLLSLFRRKTQ